MCNHDNVDRLIAATSAVVIGAPASQCDKVLLILNITEKDT